MKLEQLIKEDLSYYLDNKKVAIDKENRIIYLFDFMYEADELFEVEEKELNTNIYNRDCWIAYVSQDGEFDKKLVAIYKNKTGNGFVFTNEKINFNNWNLRDYGKLYGAFVKKDNIVLLKQNEIIQLKNKFFEIIKNNLKDEIIEDKDDYYDCLFNIKEIEIIDDTEYGSIVQIYFKENILNF